MGISYPVDENIIQGMVQVIVREAHPEKIILFGSRAKGKAQPDSDVDFLVIEKEPFTNAAAVRKSPVFQKPYLDCISLLTSWSIVRRKLNIGVIP